MIQRAQDYIYHFDCFECAICDRKLETGDEYFLMEDRKLLCREDFESSRTKGKKKTLGVLRNNKKVPKSDPNIEILLKILYRDIKQREIELKS